LLISVRDNGIGPPDNIVPGMGLGCVIEWGGEWKLSPRIEGGSQLLVTLPNT
jgi:glucose-6-phosphate-specific signal transduction histidine kinase